MSVALTSAEASRSSSHPISASGIVHDEQTQTRTIPQSVRPDGSVRKARRVKPGYTPQEDVARFRSKRLLEEDARRAADQAKSRGQGAGPPGSASWIAAAAAASPASEDSCSPVASGSRGGSSKYSSQLISLHTPSGKAQQDTPNPALKQDLQQALPHDRANTSPTSKTLSKTRAAAPSATLASPSQPGSVSTSKSTRPGGLFARAMGAATGQSLSRGESSDLESSSLGRPNERATRTAGARGEQDNRGNQPRPRRDVAKGAVGVHGRTRGAEARMPRPGSDAPSWRRGGTSTQPLATSTAAKDQSTSDGLDEVTAGLGSLQMHKDMNAKPKEMDRTVVRQDNG